MTTSITSSIVILPINFFASSTTGNTTKSYLFIILATSSSSVVAFTEMISVLMISLIGGCIGIALGLGVIFGVSEYFNWKMSLDYISLVLSFVFSSSIGIIFGFYPARKAANLNPIDALRYE